MHIHIHIQTQTDQTNIHIQTQTDQTNPAYFVIGGIMGCIPLAYIAIQACAIRYVCISVYA